MAPAGRRRGSCRRHRQRPHPQGRAERDHHAPSRARRAASPATAARRPRRGSTSRSGVTLTGDGGFLIADAGNARIRRVAPNGIISTVAGRRSRASAATAAARRRPSSRAHERRGPRQRRLPGRRRRRTTGCAASRPLGAIFTVAGRPRASSATAAGRGAAELDTPPERHGRTRRRRPGGRHGERRACAALTDIGAVPPPEAGSLDRRRARRRRTSRVQPAAWPAPSSRCSEADLGPAALARGRAGRRHRPHRARAATASSSPTAQVSCGTFTVRPGRSPDAAVADLHPGRRLLKRQAPRRRRARPPPTTRKNARGRSRRSRRSPSGSKGGYRTTAAGYASAVARRHRSGLIIDGCDRTVIRVHRGHRARCATSAQPDRDACRRRAPTSRWPAARSARSRAAQRRRASAVRVEHRGPRPRPSRTVPRASSSRSTRLTVAREVPARLGEVLLAQAGSVPFAAAGSRRSRRAPPAGAARACRRTRRAPPPGARRGAAPGADRIAISTSLVAGCARRRRSKSGRCTERVSPASSASTVALRRASLLAEQRELAEHLPGAEHREDRDVAERGRALAPRSGPSTIRCSVSAGSSWWKTTSPR